MKEQGEQSAYASDPVLFGVRALVVDDDAAARAFFVAALEDEGAVVASAAGVQEAIAHLARGRFELAVIDKNLPDGSGIEVARVARQAHEDMELILMSAHATVTSAVAALQLGVSDYLFKPLDNLEDFYARLVRVLATQALRRDNARLLEELKHKNAALEEMVVREPLTGLFNHKHLQEILAQEIERSKRHQNPCFSLLFLDVDHFKSVNDRFGHQAGDEVLRRLARMLEGGGRRCDVGFRAEERNALAGRYGGDEFTLVLPGTSKAGAAVKAERLRKAVQAADLAHVGIDDTGVITVSIGVATFPEDAGDRDGLVRAADAALYAAKQQGRNSVVTYDPWLSSKSDVQRVGAAHAERANALQRALDRRSVRYAFQPIIGLQSPIDLVAYEALCRPSDAAFSNPTLLFKAAESVGRVAELGRACREIALSPITRLDPSISVFLNVHPLEVTRELVEELEGLPPALARRLVFEVTEGSRIDDWTHLRRIADELRRCGSRIAVDDLGAGYAGLSALVKLQPDFVKLDAELVWGLQTEDGTARLIRHVLEFAAGEGARVVAEGVETRDQLSAVRDIGCSLAQGYFIARPGPPFPTIDLARLASPAGAPADALEDAL